jgi:hypothetical protein
MQDRLPIARGRSSATTRTGVAQENFMKWWSWPTGSSPTTRTAARARRRKADDPGSGCQAGIGTHCPRRQVRRKAEGGEKWSGSCEPFASRSRLPSCSPAAARGSGSSARRARRMPPQRRRRGASTASATPTAVADASPAPRRPRHRLHGDGRHPPDPFGRRQGGGADVLRGLHEGRRGRQEETDRVPVQRRARVRNDLASHGVLRPEAGEDG